MVLENLPGWEKIIFITLVVLFLVAGIITAIILLSRRAWPYKVLILENQTGHGSRPKYRDKAKLVSIGDGGEEIFYLKKTKKYRVAYGKYIGHNYIAWTIGRDGYWYNTTFGDVDKNLLEVGVMPVDRDMRYATSAVRKLVKDAYESKTFLEKYGALVYGGMFLFMILIYGGVMYYSFSQQAKVAAANTDGVKTVERVMEVVQQVTSNLDNICSGGSGIRTIVPAPV
jgi:hypothetical protein